MSESIMTFRGKYDFLSNMYSEPLNGMDGRIRTAKQLFNPPRRWIPWNGTLSPG